MDVASSRARMRASGDMDVVPRWKEEPVERGAGGAYAGVWRTEAGESSAAR